MPCKNLLIAKFKEIIDLPEPLLPPNKISSCVLLNLDVNYTPQQYQTFRPNKNRKGAPPVEMDLKLDFMETRLITKELIKDGY